MKFGLDYGWSYDIIKIPLFQHKYYKKYIYKKI